MQRCGRVRIGHRVRNRDAVVDIGDDPLGVTGRGAGQRAAAAPVRIHALAGGQHPAATATTGNVGRFEREVLTSPARPQQRVEVDDVRGRRSQNHLARTRRGVGDLLDRHDVGAAELPHLDRTHSS
ncbi:hypothetical protein [Salinifilum ghardaiensis]